MSATTSPIANVCLPPHAISPHPPIVAHDDERASARRLRPITRRALKPDDTSKECASGAERYTDEWWAREKRLEDQIRPKLIICRGC